MALIKQIGETNYHRILNVILEVNGVGAINVLSYTSKQKRTEEKDYERSEVKDINGIAVYTYTRYYEFPYQDFISIQDAYEYLKTLPEFEGAVDDLNEGQRINSIEEE